MSNPHTDDTFMYENRLMADLESAYDAHSKQDSVTLTDPLVWRITHQRGPAVSRKAAADALRGIDPDVLNEEAAKKQEKALDEMTEWAETNGLYDDYEKDEHLEYELNRESQELEYDFVSLSDDFLSALDGEDKVNNPHHYNTGDIECIDAIKASMSPEAFKGYLKGNTEKYLWRYSYKNGLEDLKKARWYLNYLIQMESE